MQRLTAQGQTLSNGSFHKKKQIRGQEVTNGKLSEETEF
jgi:hypothetical protein